MLLGYTANFRVSSVPKEGFPPSLLAKVLVYTLVRLAG